MVEGKPYYAHKVIVSLLSERFRTMLEAGLQESSQQDKGDGKTVVKIEEVSYMCFSELMTYLYTGRFDILDTI